MKALLALLALPLAVQAADAPQPPVQMGPVDVVESVLKIKVLIEYTRFGNTDPFVTSLRVDTVKAGSIAEKAGVRPGMEIVAIQGRKVTGLSEGQMQQALNCPVPGNTLTLTVRRGWFHKPEDLRIPIPK